MIRALEYFQQTGEPISLHNQREREKKAAYNSAYFVLNAPGLFSMSGSTRRVDEMLEDWPGGGSGAPPGPGAARAEHGFHAGTGLQGDPGLAGRRISYPGGSRGDLKTRDTRHFAKRQITWFKRERDVIWIDKDAF